MHKFTIIHIMTRASKYTFKMSRKVVGNVYIINMTIDINLLGNIFLKVIISGFPELRTLCHSIGNSQTNTSNMATHDKIPMHGKSR